MTLSPRRLRLALPFLLLWISVRAGAANLPPARGAIATLGDRTVEVADIQAAAASLSADPLRVKSSALWRKGLLDRCVDRELLAAEALRRGYDRDPGVRSRIAEREYVTLLRETHDRILVPGIEPTRAQLDSLVATGLYRWVDLDYILVPARFADDARQMVDRLRAGARFDSTARLWSRHPSGAAGGHFGLVLARDLDPRSYNAIRSAKTGDLLGPFSGPYGHEIYRIAGFQDLAPDSLRRMVRDERTRGLMQDYAATLLRAYHFAVDTTEAQRLIFTVATEPVDSILASLGPAGTRPAGGPRRAIGVLARVDGDSVMFADLVTPNMATWKDGGKIQLRDAAHLARRCAAAIVPRLAVRDAKDRGLDRRAAVARALRLLREEVMTRAMVAREAGKPPDAAALRAYFASHAPRYVRPRATRARAACFDTLEGAARALKAWNGVGIGDSSLSAFGLKPQPHATATTLLPGRTAEITVLETDGDPLAVSVRALDAGQLTPTVRNVQGYVLAEILNREASRPLSFEEAAPSVTADYQEEREALWVDRALEKLRATTKIDVVPSRLQAVRLDAGGTKKGTH